ncbi:hypothetical protein [Umezawaea tangerina]|uniref:Secreted protein n=1 Tax=Umezawaea tangerina TaxID=84725 RepID=A0A2T0TL98_9PSEU|nr:hypothetical protein [Umezawaea tangerina]PRY46443.1 hypothetical protein CLV43_101719 [Umezawaea tangerina]
MKAKLAAGLLVPVLFALVTGCGAKDDGGGGVASVKSGAPTSSSSDKPKGASLDPADMDKMREFAKCMRDNGVNMPDPQEGGGVIALGSADAESVDADKMKKADEACRKLLPNGGEFKEPSQEEKDKMREQAKCLREHGIDMPDPDAESSGKGQAIPLDDTAKLQEAMKACGMGDGGMVALPAVPANG